MLRRLLPFSRLGIALWAWRNRDKVADWSQFAVRSAGTLVREGSIDDARAELRLRTSLATDGRTRNASLYVSVVDGVARLEGRSSGPARDAAVELARSTNGVTRVHENVEVPPARGRRRVRSRA
jgi:osmotically-inducible protein OsmY